MTVLVTAADRHGATREIAEAIARVLGERGLSAELVDIDEVSDVARYEAVVLSSAVYSRATTVASPTDVSGGGVR